MYKITSGKFKFIMKNKASNDIDWRCSADTMRNRLDRDFGFRTAVTVSFLKADGTAETDQSITHSTAAGYEYIVTFLNNR